MSCAEVLRGNLAMDWVLRAALEAHAAQRLPAQAIVQQALPGCAWFLLVRKG